MSKTIYVVTSGEYSSYHIVAATTNKEKADKIAKKFTTKYEECEVEEYEDSDIYLKPVYKVVFECGMNLIISCNLVDDPSEWTYDNIGRWLSSLDGRYTFVAADTEDEACKIAFDKRAEYLAEKKGIKC